MSPRRGPREWSEDIPHGRARESPGSVTRRSPREMNERFAPSPWWRCRRTLQMDFYSCPKTRPASSRLASCRLRTGSRRNQRSADGTLGAGQDRTEIPELRSRLPRHPGSRPRGTRQSSSPTTDPAVQGSSRTGMRAEGP